MKKLSFLLTLILFSHFSAMVKAAGESTSQNSHGSAVTTPATSADAASKPVVAATPKSKLYELLSACVPTRSSSSAVESDKKAEAK